MDYIQLLRKEKKRKEEKKKLIDCCTGYKASKRNSVGNDPRLRFGSASTSLFTFFFFLRFSFLHQFSEPLSPSPSMAIYRKRPFGAGATHPGELELA